MTATTNPIAVLGATGQQGSAVVDALLAAGHPVRAVVRTPDSPKATALAARGVEVVPGDQDDPDSLRQPLTGVAALFLMTTFSDESGTEGEVRRGVATADAAAAAGVPRVVYSSVGGAERRSGVPHFESKYRVEQHLASTLPTLVVRPTFFMDNFAGQLDAAGDGEFVLRQPMPGDVPLQMVAVRDIGVVAAAALADPQALGGDSLEIAGDELTGEQIAARIGARLGRPARFEQVPLDVLPDEDLEAMFRWFVETDAYQADLERTRSIDPDVLDLDGWLARRA
jgi:uncharacterized protein YbjT (DUF2867 family)